MAKIQDVSVFLKDVESGVFSSRGMKQIGKIAKEIIYKRVKSGYGVDSERSGSPKKKRLKPLSDSYKAYRRGDIEFRTVDGRVIPFPGDRRNKVTGKFGKPGKSNLTFSGEMLDSFEIKAGKLELELIIPNTRRRDGKTNSEVYEFARKDRPFFAITNAERRILTAEIEDKIVKIANKYF